MSTVTPSEETITMPHIVHALKAPPPPFYQQPTPPPSEETIAEPRLVHVIKAPPSLQWQSLEISGFAPEEKMPMVRVEELR
jgi:hypothetical protein